MYFTAFVLLSFASVYDAFNRTVYRNDWPKLSLSNQWNSDFVVSINNKNEMCKYVPDALAWNKINYNMCVRPYPDRVSSQIIEFRKWNDCGILSKLWSLQTVVNDDIAKEDPYFLDVGSNIGSCVFPFLANNVRSIAFEPVDANLFYFTSTVLANNGFHKNLRLYKAAASDSVGTQKIYTEDANAGNSVIGKKVPVEHANYITSEIHTVILDDILWPDPTTKPPHIKVMKMDAQGYEIHVLNGAKRLLAAGAIGIIQFEVASLWLETQGTTTEQLLHLIHDFGYDIYTCNPKKFILYLLNPENYGKRKGIYNLTAKRR
jgi:FkbM family methyltransferase